MANHLDQAAERAMALLEPMRLKDPAQPTQMMEAAEKIPRLISGRLGADKSIEVFFKMLEYAKLDEHAAHRRHFWQAYLDAGAIHQTWIILAPGTRQYAMQELGLRLHQFASLKKNRRVDDQHAVLLMRMSGVIIAEWSHVGKCRFWLQTNTKAPSFFKHIYDRDELIDHADHVQQHYFSVKGLWQKDAAAWLADTFGIVP